MDEASSNPHCVEEEIVLTDDSYVYTEQCVRGGETTVVTNSYTEIGVAEDVTFAEENHNVAIAQEDGVKVNGWNTTEFADEREHETYHIDPSSSSTELLV